MNPLLWLFPILSGVADAGTRIAIKRGDMHNFLLSGCGLLCGIPFYVVWLLIEGMPTIQPSFWLAVMAHIPLFALVCVFIVEAHRSGSMIKVMPYSSLTPAFLLITAPLMDGGTPTFLGAIGILILVVGLYVLNVESGLRNLWEPMRAIALDRAARFMLGVAAITAVSNNLDKIALFNANGPFYLLIDHGVAALLILGVIPFYLSKGWMRGEKKVERNGRVEKETVTLTIQDLKDDLKRLESYTVFASFGVLTAATAIFHLIGLKLLPHVPYFVSGKRTGSILFAMAFGLLMYLREIKNKVPIEKRKFADEIEHLKWKLGGTAIIIAGMLIIILKGNAESVL